MFECCSKSLQIIRRENVSQFFSQMFALILICNSSQYFFQTLKLHFPDLHHTQFCAFKVSESWIQTSSKLPWSRIHFPSVTPAVTSNEPARARRVKKRQAASTAGGSEVFPISIEYSKPLWVAWVAWVAQRALSMSWKRFPAHTALARETCGCRLSMKHFFSCESNKDKQRWIQGGSKLWTFDASPQPLWNRLVKAVTGKASCFNLATVFQGHRDGWAAVKLIAWFMASFAQCLAVTFLVIGSSCEDLSKGQSKEGDTKVRVPAEQFIGKLSADLPRFYQLCCGSLTWADDVGKCGWAWGANWGTWPNPTWMSWCKPWKNWAITGQPLRTDASSFGLPARRRRLYILFVRQVNPKLLTQTRSLTESFVMSNNMVASCLRSPPLRQGFAAKSRPRRGWKPFLEERKEKSAKAASKSPQVFRQLGRPTHEVLQKLKGCDGDSHTLKNSSWIRGLKPWQPGNRTCWLLSRAQAPDAGFRNVSQSLGRVHTASWCKDTKKRVAPTMLPGQLLFLELVKPPRLMLDQEALLFQGFPAPQFLKLVERDGRHRCLRMLCCGKRLSPKAVWPRKEVADRKLDGWPCRECHGSASVACDCAECCGLPAVQTWFPERPHGKKQPMLSLHWESSLICEKLGSWGLSPGLQQICPCLLIGALGASAR